MALAAIIGLFGSIGCKPKSTSLTGQVFIATAGGTSFKLGAVEIQLIDKKQVVEFLSKQRAAFDLKIQSQKKKLIAIKADIEKAKVEARKAQVEFDFYVQSKAWRTSEAYTNAEAEIVRCTDGIAAWDKQISILNNKRDFMGVRAAVGARTSFVFKSTKAQNDLDEIERAAIRSAEGQNNARQSVLLSLEAKVATINNSINTPPLPDDYLSGFSPTTTQKTITDADGNFSISYLRNEQFTIYSRAQRAVMDNTEKYCWLINAPSGIETGRVSLNNQNLAEFDPDGYFNLKPATLAQ